MKWEKVLSMEEQKELHTRLTQSDAKLIGSRKTVYLGDDAAQQLWKIQNGEGENFVFSLNQKGWVTNIFPIFPDEIHEFVRMWKDGEIPLAGNTKWNNEPEDYTWHTIPSDDELSIGNRK